MKAGPQFHSHNPYLIFKSYYATLCPNFDFKLKRDHRKISDELHAYESVDDGSLLDLGYILKKK